jgi:uncharacterized membrane protein YoaK (UPF0700 family)
MLRHTGERRNYRHNIRLAALLCITAGFVNISGLMGFAVLTTNVTGHAALFAEKLSTGDYRAMRTVALWMLLFLAGAFASSYYIARVGRERRASYTLPIIVEILILVWIGSYGNTYDKTLLKTEYFAGSLLFAMGMQNALVSVISGSVVRTTHLTGMFTDLGIDLATVAQKHTQQPPDSWNKILLKLVIIVCFLSGGIIGGFMFKHLAYHTFFIPAGILVVVLFYDYFRIKVARMLYRQKQD